MEKISPRILAFDDAPSATALKSRLTKWRYDHVVYSQPEAVIDEFKADPRQVLLIDAESRRSNSLITTLYKMDADAVIVLLAPPDRLEKTIAAFRPKIFDCLPKPLSKTIFSAAFHRAQALFRLRMELQQIQDATEHQSPQKAAEQIETERFVAVRQIVERMSIFINNIAGSVQGGVQYFNELPYFVSIHDTRCRIMTANPTYAKYLGNPLNRNSWDIYCGKHGTREMCPVGLSLKTGNVLDTRALVRYQSGAQVPVLVHTAPIYNNDGEVELVLEVFAGTKEIERLGAEIQSTQQRYQHLFDAVPSKIVVLDRRFRLTAANRRFREDFGEHTGKLFFDILRPGSFPAYRDPISLTVKNGEPHQGEMVLTDRDGMQYNMMTWTAPIKTPTGKLIQVIAIFGDVTELRRLQTDLSRLGLMVSTISHDLKGSLTGLDAGLYLIDKGFYRNRPGQIEEGLDVAQLMVDRIRKMVFDILYSAKERELELEAVDVLKFSGDVASNVENKIRAANIRFECKFGNRLGSIHIDQKLIRSSLLNILDNAIEACIEDSSEDPSVISFSVERKKKQIHFEIRDNGSGMPSSEKNKIFDMFYSSKGRKGTGIGLYITRKAIRKHGGTIEVETNAGQGSRFVVSLPVK